MQKETSLCMGCMNDKNYDGPCKLCGYSDSDPCIPTYLVPKTFLNERYIVGKLLSYNGEGAVYIGYDTMTKTRVTIKEFMPDTLCSRMKGETEISVNADNSALYKTYMSEFADLHRSLMKLRGMAHIQAVLDIFYENGTCYAVLEFISGISLKTFLENSAGELSWEQVKELFPPILTTLSLIHAAGIIHRGISPQTIFVTDKMELKLAGFCISAERTTNTEIACEMFSGYAAPEQYTNEINGTWTDVYGISAVLYRVLTGTAPAEAIARSGNPMLEPMMINRNVPQNVSKVIMNGMKLSTETRIRSVTEFVDKLFAPPRYIGNDANRASDGSRLTSREKKMIEKKQKERRKTLAVLIGVGVVLIIFAIAFALAMSGVFGKNEPEPVSESSSSSTSSSSTISSSSTQSSSTTESTESTAESSSEPPAATIQISDFKDCSYEKTAARYEGKLVFVPTYDYSDEYSAGMIFDQSIEPGEFVPLGTQIKVKVSKGKSVVPLPEYKGDDEATYTAKLEKLNIKYIVQTKKSNDVPDGTVLKCSKEVGDLVRVSELEMVVVVIAENYEESSSGETESSRD
ncbi:MAG: protein kinase [[Eubacterium] saphenum]|nr:protein kinase [[Eubacterium] saphenum]